MIRAFAELRRQRSARLMIIGDGRRRRELEALITALGLEEDVSLHRFVENPFPYFLRAKLLVLSSTYEGLPTVLIEALALGTPIVATDCPSGPREILQDGAFGDLVPVGDVAALATAMNRALSGDAKPRAPEEWLDQFRAEVAAQRYLDELGIRQR
jgi:glycosyltransferase involved in cell wall biosynthesis